MSAPYLKVVMMAQSKTHLLDKDKATVVIGLLGTQLDRPTKQQKKAKKASDISKPWRPTLSLFQHPDLPIQRLELLHDNHSQALADQLTLDILEEQPNTQVIHQNVNFASPWDFECVYGELFDFVRRYPFDPENEQYLLHMTTGTHVAQICWFLLTEAGFIPAQLIQSAPPNKKSGHRPGYDIIDLDLSRYDQIASRFETQRANDTDYLKSGIATQNPAFNRMISEIEQVAIASKLPILLSGPTGSGKSQLAKRIFELKQRRGQCSGKLIEINCATLRGDNAMSSLFGHTKGAFTGALKSRNGCLKEANHGLLFLDEIGELGLDEQAMLLRAIEEKTFTPLGADQSIQSDFQLIAGTNRDLLQACEAGEFRYDLLARIHLWSYQLPALASRREDIEPNLDYELQRWSQTSKKTIQFNREAREQYLQFALSKEAIWLGNFRDLNASVSRMATLAKGSRIDQSDVFLEIQRLKTTWGQSKSLNKANKPTASHHLSKWLSSEQLASLDSFDQHQLAWVLEICQNAHSQAEAGRQLFDKSRLTRKTQNDTHRLRQYLAKYGLHFDQITKGS